MSGPTDESDGLFVRVVDPDFVRSLMGKYRHLATETVDEGRRAAREEQAEREDQRDRAQRVRPGDTRKPQADREL